MKMTNPAVQPPSKRTMTLLSRLLITPRSRDRSPLSPMEGLKTELRAISRPEFDELAALANSNHVIIRALEIFLDAIEETGDEMRAEWAESALKAEKARIATALEFLGEICTAFEVDNYDVAVIKSLDHWPDLGSDLDLYTNAQSQDVARMMKRRFDAQIAERSWGDRLAHKWNFMIPGLNEAVEIHMGRLGQTGEQVVIASRLIARTRRVLLGNQEFRVPSASDRLMISTLQRMYRHFYFRLCDIVDSAALLDSGGVDLDDLRCAATAAGIWEGVATYLVIVSDYMKKYSGVGLDLPEFVLASARFGGDQVFYAKEFIRVPIMPQSAALYGSQLAGLLKKRELQSGARLSLLPWLATAALVGQKVTGSDKGIW
jgi:hypothetical protein